METFLPHACANTEGMSNGERFRDDIRNDRFVFIRNPLGTFIVMNNARVDFAKYFYLIASYRLLLPPRTTCN